MNALRPNLYPISPASDHRERSDIFAGEILRRGDWHVALCGDGLQWIPQHRRSSAQEGARAAWDNVSFRRTRLALLRPWRAHAGGDRGVLEQLLPAHAKAVPHGR